MIVLSHAAGHGFYDSSINTLMVDSTGNRILLKSMLAGSLGVDIFVMISGWFLIGAKDVAGSKGVQLAARTWLYSVLGFVLLSATPFSIIEAKTYLLPVTYGVYWFVTAYLSCSSSARTTTACSIRRAVPRHSHGAPCRES